jgi:CDP-diglyceride synthetase
MPGYLIVTVCGAIYLAGLMLSSSDFRFSGIVVALIGLLLLLLHYGTSRSHKPSLAPFKRWRRWTFFIAIVSIVLIKLGYEMAGIWCAGLAVYSYSCICLRHQAVYHGGEIRFESMWRVKKKDSPLRYWFFVALFSALGLSLLILPALACA